jgi:flagellar hook-basal body complex protein FliE
MSYSVGLQAVNAYNNISNTTAVSNAAQTSNLKNANGAAKFQDMVNANFNQFATMTQAEILKQVSQANNNISAINNPSNIVKSNQNNASFVTEVVKDISEKVRKQEELSLKRVVGEASITDVAMASVQATNAFKLATELRNKMQDFIDKTMNINI